MIRTLLVPASKILMPVLHIKIGLATQLFKKLYIFNANLRKELDKLFPTLAIAKKKAGVFNGPQITTLFESNNILNILKTDKKQHLFA